MPIYLPGEIQFTDQDDFAPMSWDIPQAISNYGVTYTLAGNDLITGTSRYFDQFDNGGTGFLNRESAIFNTGSGRDEITGQGLTNSSTWDDSGYHGYGIDNRGRIETGDDGDYLSSYGTFYNSGMVSLGDGDDGLYAQLPSENVANNYSAFSNYGTIEAGNGDDVLNVVGRFNNSGSISLGLGNDSINVSGYGYYNNGGLINSQTIETGDGDDRITSRVMSNYGFINTGNGKDSLIATYLYGSGSVFLGDGEDYLSAFGSGYYEGGNDQDSLELTSDCYTIEIGGGGVSFTRTWDGKVMQTFGFEKLIVGSTTYDFTSFYDGLTICT